MAYRLEIKRAAQRSLIRISRSASRDADRIEKAIDSLTADAYPPGSVKIRARPSIWRLRTGAYRVIYAVFEADGLIIIGRIERRSERTYADVEDAFS